MDPLTHIKRLVLSGNLAFTLKARQEMRLDGITEAEVGEAIVNAHRIDKVLRSHSPLRSHPSEKLYVIKGLTFNNRLLYTKGKIVREAGAETFYVLISSKTAE